MNEYQNAYALSHMERRMNDPRIKQELSKGYFCVVSNNPQHCPFTDAPLPDYKWLEYSFRSFERANKVANLLNKRTYGYGEYWYEVLWPYPKKQEPVSQIVTDDIPF